MNVRICLFLATLLCVGSAAEAQLFKGAAQRRSARQSGGGNSYNSNNYNSGQTQQKRGLFGRKEASPTYNNSRQSSQNYNSSNEKQRYGLLGRPKEPKQGGLFNRNKVETEKSGGLFSRGRERREQEAYSSNQNSSQRYSNQNYNRPQYTQQQQNHQASASYVQRSQTVTSAKSLFDAKPDIASAQPAASAPTSPSSSTESGRTIFRDPATGLIIRDPVGDRDAKPAVQAASKLVAKAASASREAERPALPPRTRPKVPLRTRPSARPAAADLPTLKNTAQDNPVAKPTGVKPGFQKPDLSPTPAVLA